MNEALAQIRQSACTKRTEWQTQHTQTDTYTEHEHTSFQHMPCCKWTICCWFQSRAALWSVRQVLGIIRRLRLVERPIGPHFYLDGLADQFPVVELLAGWSHTHIHTCTVACVQHKYLPVGDREFVVKSKTKRCGKDTITWVKWERYRGSYNGNEF